MGSAAKEGGMGHGQNPYGHMNDVKHFDKEGHFRTHDKQEKRRQQRRDEDYVPIVPPAGMLGQFLFIGGIISLGVLLPGYFFERLTAKNKKDR
jgi:hypothetical protein